MAVVTLALRMMSVFTPPVKPLSFTGPNSIRKISGVLLAKGFKRPLIVTDKHFLDNKILDEFLDELKSNDLEVSIYTGIKPNPTFNDVEIGLQQAKVSNADCIIAIGGGSVIDVSKVISGAVTNKNDIKKLAGLNKLKNNRLPFFVVPTTSGSGSETTIVAVVSDSQTHRKNFFIDRKYIPDAIALDPELLKTLPKHITASVGMDALTHALEAYTSKNSFLDTDQNALMAISLLMKYLPVVYDEPDNLHAREMVSQASFLAGYAFTKSSLGYVHAISHQVSAIYNTPHGLANAVILSEVLKFNLSKCERKYAEIERELGNNNDNSQKELAHKFLERVDKLKESLEIPSKINEIKKEDFNKISKWATSEARFSYSYPKRMSRNNVKKVLKAISI